MQRYVCIHGHFYQPPRENPWLEAVERQDSAAPFHDWNERVTAECYRPNAQSRILDSDGWITAIRNNYARISFNFGPTLLSWLERHAPDVHDAVIAADRESAERFGGHGSALAQPFNHMIMPLANKRDRVTQIRWGLADFRHRFGRDARGVWLPETAADTPTLEDLTEHEVEFTVLAPRQAKRFRHQYHGDWRDCASGGGIDPSRAYRCELPSGRSIALFFYDGPISQAVAFERLLDSGHGFAGRLCDGLSDQRGWPQLAHIATDGETYGHHHRYGDMALAVALDEIEADPGLRLTNYAEFLERHPPDHDVQIYDNSSWSCVHGVERWRSDCGCNAGHRPGWDQSFRAPLREALDRLRDGLSPLYERAAAEFLRSPWEARDDYVTVVNDRSEESLRRFFNTHAVHPLNAAERSKALHLLEMQRQAMQMYTSCGWFFDDISGIEAVQVLLYAARAVQLAEHTLGRPFEAELLRGLEKCTSNVRSVGTGRDVYERFVRPSVVNLPRVGAHYAVSALFREGAPAGDVYCYAAESLGERTLTAGRTKLIVGKVGLTSRVTLSSETLSFAVLHAGDHIIAGGARPARDREAFEGLVSGVESAFDRGDIAGIIKAMEGEFGPSSFSLGSLFKDEQRRIAKAITHSAVTQVESVSSSLHEQYSSLLRYLGNLGIPVPPELVLPAQLVINRRILSELALPRPDGAAIRKLVAEAERQSIPLDGPALLFHHAEAVASLAKRLVSDPRHDLLERLAMMLDVADVLPEQPDLSRAQLTVYQLLHGATPRTGPEQTPLSNGDRALLESLAERLRVALPAAAPS